VIFSVASHRSSHGRVQAGGAGAALGGGGVAAGDLVGQDQLEELGVAEAVGVHHCLVSRAGGPHRRPRPVPEAMDHQSPWVVRTVRAVLVRVVVGFFLLVAAMGIVSVVGIRRESAAVVNAVGG